MWGATGVRAIADELARDPELVARMKADPRRVLEHLAERADEAALTFRIVVVALVVVAIIATAGGVVLSLLNRAVPQLLLALGSVAVGALIALLAPSVVRRL